MYDKIIFLTCVIALSQASFGQSVSINTDGSPPDSSAILDVNEPGKGLLIPRTDTAAVNASGPATGLMIFDTNTNSFWYYDGNMWTEFFSSAMFSYKYPDRDQDGDGDKYGALYSPSLHDGFVSNSNDCNDRDSTIHTRKVETCNGIDDNCNGQVDEDGNLCPPTDNANEAACEGETGCVITACNPEHFDMDGVYENGCECNPIELDKNESCAASIGVDGEYTGNLVPKGDLDWLHFTTGANTDAIQISLASSPSESYRIDVWEDCSGQSSVREGVTDTGNVSSGPGITYYIKVYSLEMEVCGEYLLMIQEIVP